MYFAQSDNYTQMYTFEFFVLNPKRGESANLVYSLG